MFRIADIEQQTEARARAAGETNLGIHRDVVALIRTRRRLIAAPCAPARLASAAALAARLGFSLRLLAIALILRRAVFVARRDRQSLEDARRTDDRRLHRRAQRDFDHFEAEARGVRIVVAAVLHPGTSSAERTPAVPDT
jgi:hypothetical protein